MTHLRSFPLLLLIATLMACGATSEPNPPLSSVDAGLKDGGAQEDAGALDAGKLGCSTLGVPEQLTATPGRRITLDLSSTEGTIQMANSGGWRAFTPSDDRQLILRAPYETGSSTLELTFDCDHGNATTVSLDATVIAPTWRELWSQTETRGPPNLLRPSLFTDPVDVDRLYVLGGLNAGFAWVPRLWTFSRQRQTWAELADFQGQLDPGGTIVVESSNPRVVTIFDEGATATTPPFATLDYRGDTPVLHTSAPLAPTTGWYGGAFFYIAGLDRYVAACGARGTDGHCDVVVYDVDSEQWQVAQVSADSGTPPRGRHGFAYAWDPVAQRLLVFSGAHAIVNGGYVGDSETWSLTVTQAGFHWQQLTLPGAPGARVYGCAAYDQDNHRLLIFGGRINNLADEAELYALDMDEGLERWSAIPTQGGPSGRALCAAQAAPSSGSFVIGYGNAPDGARSDLWSLEF